MRGADPTLVCCLCGSPAPHDIPVLFGSIPREGAMCEDCKVSIGKKVINLMIDKIVEAAREQKRTQTKHPEPSKGS